MTMTPEEFHDLLTAATADPPPGAAVTAALRAGQRSLRRRRAASALGATLVVVALGAGTAVATGLGDGPDRPTSVSEPHTDAQLLAACRHAGSTPAPPAGLVFGRGTPTVEAAVRTDQQWLLAIQSGDGRYWAECSVDLAAGHGFPAELQVFDSTQRSDQALYSMTGCAIVHGHYRPSCTSYTIETVDRLPTAVAAVRYRFGDGGSLTVRSQHGYVVLNRLARLPDPTPPPGTSSPLPGITRITYLDAAGRPLAAMALDGTGTGPRNRVDGLPPLKAYPSLRGDPIPSPRRGPGGRSPRSPGASSVGPPASPPGTASPAS
jgi:hypothetical protein